MTKEPDGTRRLLRAGAGRTAAAALLWWLLTEGAGGWLLGVPAVALAVGASLALAPPSPSRRLSLPGLLGFCGAFVVRSVIAGSQVARFAFSPRAALAPARRTITTTLPPGLPRVLLAGTLTLQPGTLSVGLDGDRLVLHVLDEGAPFEADVRALEARIAALLGLAA